MRTDFYNLKVGDMIRVQKGTNPDLIEVMVGQYDEDEMYLFSDNPRMDGNTCWSHEEQDRFKYSWQINPRDPRRDSIYGFEKGNNMIKYLINICG